jgi:uncharacterized protein
MKLHADSNTPLNTVTAYGPGFIEVNRVRHAGAVLLRPEGPILPWPIASFETIEEATLTALLQWQPEVVLLGTGDRQRFLHPRLLRGLTARGVGIDPMDTRAACRTYNILMAEGRQVLAALLPPQQEG